MHLSFPHSQVSESHYEPRNTDGVPADFKAHSVSISTQTDDRPQKLTRVSKTIATQTADNSQAVSQSTPLLSSLICSQLLDEASGTHQEASTSPTPQYDDLFEAGGTGEWTGVDGVNGGTVAWDSCAPPAESLERNVNDDILQDVFRYDWLLPVFTILSSDSVGNCSNFIFKPCLFSLLGSQALQIHLNVF